MSSAPLRVDNLVIPQGTTWAIQWPLQDTDGGALNVAGWTVRAQVRRRYGAEEVLHEWSSELGNASFLGDRVELRVEPAESQAWTWGGSPAVYDVELTSSIGAVTRLTQGQISVSPEVTR